MAGAPALLIERRDDAVAALLLGHGAGAAMDSPFMNAIVALLAERGVATVRFEFAYMAARRLADERHPSPKAEKLVAEYAAAFCAAQSAMPGLPWYVGGKSLGGRVASLWASGPPPEDAAGQSPHRLEAAVRGVVCLGYPLHPPAKPEQLRIAHLARLTVPCLIAQGERDPFGNRAEIARLTSEGRLGAGIEWAWLADGDHDFGPRGRSGHTRKGNLTEAADKVAEFMGRHA